MPRIATTTVPLLAAGTYTQEIEVGLGDRITGAVFADQIGTIFLEQSGDEINWDVSTSYAVPASDGKGFSEEILLPFVRIRYVNGGTPQTIFRLFIRITSAGPRS